MIRRGRARTRRCGRLAVRPIAFDACRSSSPKRRRVRQRGDQLSSRDAKELKIRLKSTRFLEAFLGPVSIMIPSYWFFLSACFFVCAIFIMPLCQALDASAGEMGLSLSHANYGHMDYHLAILDTV